MLELNGLNGGNISIGSVVENLNAEQRKKLADGYDLKKFKKIFEDESMMATCAALFENSLNVSETARKMFMHRNTLIYRLNNIKKETGLNVSEFSQAVTFIILHEIYLKKGD